MDLIRNRLKALPACRGGEAVFRRDLAAVFIQSKGRKGDIIPSLLPRSGLGPLDIAHHILPAIRLQMFFHIFGVGEELLLIYCRAVAVPAVPAHGWGQGDAVFCIHGFQLSFRSPSNIRKRFSKNLRSDFRCLRPIDFLTAIIIQSRALFNRYFKQRYRDYVLHREKYAILVKTNHSSSRFFLRQNLLHPFTSL